MSRKRVEAEGGIDVRAATISDDGTRKQLTSKDCVAVHHIDIEVRECGSTIFAGFRMEWGRVDVDGNELLLCSGAGVGSSWATIEYKDKHYAISAPQLVEAFLAVIDP